MYPAQGYWRLDKSSENYIKCPQTDSCLYFQFFIIINPHSRGGSTDGGKKISLTGFCSEGYKGAACSSCAPDYARFGSNLFCFYIMNLLSFQRLTILRKL